MTVEFTASHAEGLEIVFATIIPPNSSVPMGALREFDLANFKRRIRDGLAKTSAIWAVGAVDVTLNQHRDDVFDSHWSPHAHVIVAIDDIDDLRMSCGRHSRAAIKHRDRSSSRNGTEIRASFPMFSARF